MDILLAALLSALLTGIAVWFFAMARHSAALLKANDAAAQEKGALTAEIATLRANLAAQAQQQEQMKLWFENTANKVAKETSEQLQVKSQQGLDALLAPVKERLTDFQKKVEEVYGQESRERIGLAKQIELAMQMNQQTSDAANNLANALKGDAKKRGNWGEMQLENILMETGMVAERDYYVQGKGLKLKGEDGRRQLPDFIVRMPKDQHVIIDSKVTLNSYAAWTDCKDEETGKQLISQFISAMRQHVDDLSAKKYQDHEGLKAHPQVLMFVPIEAALGAALTLDGNLLGYARSKRIVLIGPSGLMVALQALHVLMQSERMEQNANEIAKEAAGLYDKVRGVVDTLNELGRSIEKSQAVYQKAIGQLGNGPGNVLRRVESFRQRGISVEKPIAALERLPAEEASE